MTSFKNAPDNLPVEGTPDYGSFNLDRARLARLRSALCQDLDVPDCDLSDDDLRELTHAAIRGIALLTRIYRRLPRSSQDKINHLIK